MFQIKICGITTLDDARLTAEAGADAIGLNFYPPSPRAIDLAQAKAIAAVLPTEMVKVGLFVNASTEQIQRAMEAVPLDLVQLHGDEPPEFLAALRGYPILRAFRLTDTGLAPVAAYLEACRQLGCLPQAVLLDAYRPGHYGGTGEPTDWAVAADYTARHPSPPMALAGGLTADNVSEAIRRVHPAAVDTASGVEAQPGRKDPARLATFIRVAREAFRA